MELSKEDIKNFPLWSQFIERKNEWIGGIIKENPDLFTPNGAETKITDISLSKLDSGDIVFTFHGEDFDESFNVKYGGVSGGDEEWMHFDVAMCPGFKVKMPQGLQG